MGLLIAFLIEPLISRMESYNIPRMLSIGVVFLVFTIFLIWFLITAIPLLVNEAQSLKSNQDQYITYVEKLYKKGKVKVEENFPGVVPWEKIESGITYNSENIFSKYLAQIPKMLAGSAETVLSFLMIIPLTVFFILKDGFALKKWMIQFVPNRYFELVMEIIHNINQQTGAFIRGQIMDSTLNAIMISTLLAFLGLPYYLIVGVFAGVANAIPFVGPITAGSVAVLIAVISGAVNPVVVALTFLGAHLIDVMFIYPKTVGHSLNLHEMIVILGIIVGGHVGGIIGMLVIIPIIGIVFQSTKIMFRLLKGYNII